MPTPAPTSVPATSDHGATLAGSGDSAATACAAAMPNAIPDRGTDRAQRRGFDEELRQDITASRTERLPNADLSRALGDGDEHDVHDHDRADDETECRKRHAGNDHLRLDAVPELEHGLRRRQIEVVRLRRPQPPATAHHLADLLHRREQRFTVRRLHRQSVDHAVRIHEALERGALRRDRELVERDPEDRSLLLGDADDLVRQAAELQ